MAAWAKLSLCIPRLGGDKGGQSGRAPPSPSVSTPQLQLPIPSNRERETLGSKEGDTQGYKLPPKEGWLGFRIGKVPGGSPQRPSDAPGGPLPGNQGKGKGQSSAEKGPPWVSAPLPEIRHQTQQCGAGLKAAPEDSSDHWRLARP